LSDVISHLNVRLGIDDLLYILNKNQTHISFSFHDVITDASLPQWHCATRHCVTVPRWDTPEVCRRQSSLASPVCRYVNADHAVNAPFNTRWSCLLDGGCTCLEHSAFIGQSKDFTAVVSAGCQNDSVSCWHWQHVV